MTGTKGLWAGRVLSALAVVFLAFDGVIKLMRVPAVLDATVQLGFPLGSIVPIGLTLLACTVVYAIPRTSVAGSVLLTGYLGGAIAAQVRAGNPMFERTFPIIVGTVVWAGVFLRDRRVRALLAPQEPSR
jgi:DoxX-like family